MEPRSERETVRLVIDGEQTQVPAGTTVAAAVALAAAARDTAAGAANGDAPQFRRSVRRDEPRSAICGMGICHECRLTIDGVAQVRSCLVVAASGMRVGTTGHEADAAHSASALVPGPPAFRDTMSPHAATSHLAAQPHRKTPPHRATRAHSAPPIPDFADVLVVGAGPAGLAAAARAARGGRSVVIVDENPTAGGQIWRGGEDPRAQTRGALHLARTAVVDYRPLAMAAPAAGADGARGVAVLLRHDEPGAQLHEVRFRDLVLATGARELFLPFPGWTLPNVFGAGGLQSLVKSGWPVDARRVVVAGSGPLLLAVAALLRERGAEIVAVVEQAPLRRLAGFAGALLARPDKWRQSAELRMRLVGVPYRAGHWVLRAEGRGRVERVILTDGRTRWSESCDALAVGFGLVPANELARLIGCATLPGGAVRVDAQQATTVPGVWGVGEVAGIGGLDLSLAQGEILGSVLASEPAAERHSDGEHRVERRRLDQNRARAERFAALLATTFALRPELHALAEDETIVCRCEDVTWGELAGEPGWRDAKLVSRCGMGPCQGRVCGAALRELKGWEPDVPRPPISPVPVDAWGPIPEPVGEER